MFRFDAAWLHRNGLDRAIRRRPELAAAILSRCDKESEMAGAPLAAWRRCAREVRLGLRAPDVARLQRLVTAR